MLDEFEVILHEAIRSVEQALSLEDKGWINLSNSNNVITAADRKTSVTRARYYALIDPLASRSIHLMTDYSFGTGMSYNCKDEKAKEVLSSFWGSQDNKTVLSAKGQRKSSDKLLVDGEIFFALFISSNGSKVRRIDPLEITEIISDPDDAENVRYYKREWITAQSAPKVAYYCSFANEKDEAVQDSLGRTITKTQDALVYHMAINDFVGQRGNSYLLPALDWIQLYRQFLASRAAIMLALARFAWHTKRKGGAADVAATKAQLDDKQISAGAFLVENMGSDTQPIKTDTGAQNAYQDARILRLQVSASTGWPEQYYGDISIGNLATAKTVELPVMKMCQSYQSMWSGTYDDIDQMILSHAGIPEDNRYVDRDFPAISSEDASELAQSIQLMTLAFPEFASSRDVMQQALLSIGVNNVEDVLADIMAESKGMPEVKLAKALREFREVLNNGHK